MKNTEPKEFIDLFADVCILLISNGANSGRTRRNINRIASAFGYHLEMFFSHSAVVITAISLNTGEKRTVVKAVPHYRVNFNVLSEISILSWQVAERKLSYQELKEQLAEIRKIEPYSEFTKVLLASLAVAALCRIFGGSFSEFFIVFGSAVLGFIARNFLLSRHYNANMGWFAGAFVSVTFVNIFQAVGFDVKSALSACVLWLIPGVPLINGFIDVLEGHLVSGSAKLMMGMILIFMIAVGFCLSLFLFGYGFR